MAPRKLSFKIYLDFGHLVDLSKEEITDSLKQLAKVTGGREQVAGMEKAFKRIIWTF
jgi:hypothetical protein